jgi:hypothetical protein
VSKPLCGFFDVKQRKIQMKKEQWLWMRASVALMAAAAAAIAVAQQKAESR